MTIDDTRQSWKTSKDAQIAVFVTPLYELSFRACSAEMARFLNATLEAWWICRHGLSFLTWSIFVSHWHLASDCRWLHAFAYPFTYTYSSMHCAPGDWRYGRWVLDQETGLRCMVQLKPQANAFHLFWAVILGLEAGDPGSSALYWFVLGIEGQNS